MTNSFTSQITLKIKEEQKLLDQHQLKIQESLQNGIEHCEKLSNVFKTYEQNASSTMNEHIETLNQYQQQLALISEAHTQLSQQLKKLQRYKINLEEETEQQNNQMNEILLQMQSHQQSHLEILEAMANIKKLVLNSLMSNETRLKEISQQLRMKPDLNTIEEIQQAIAKTPTFILVLLLILTFSNSLILIYNSIRGI